MEAHRRSIVIIGSILASVQKVWSEDPEKAPRLQEILEKTDERLKKQADSDYRGKKGQKEEKRKKKDKEKKSGRKKKSREKKKSKKEKFKKRWFSVLLIDGRELSRFLDRIR